jgi:hypothetical protein
MNSHQVQTLRDLRAIVEEASRPFDRTEWIVGVSSLERVAPEISAAAAEFKVALTRLHEKIRRAQVKETGCWIVGLKEAA